MFNHCAANIDNPGARTGLLDHNPIHMDMCEGAQKAGLEFILNVVLNAKKKSSARSAAIWTRRTRPA